MAARREAVRSALRVRHAPASVAHARHVLASQLARAGVGATERDDAVLVLSELVSNAVRHADPLPGGDILVRWAIWPETLHLEIVDGGGGTHPHANAPPATALGGRGLEIVRTLSSSWGVDEVEHRVTVWADLARSGAPAASSLSLAPHG
jgi:anti-sigma regulatory factor (Ser/Thr protein kinase)